MPTSSRHLLAATGRWRRDRLRVWTDTIDLDNDGDLSEHRAPVTRLYPRRQQNVQKSFDQGDTSTPGTVVLPLSWLSIDRAITAGAGLTRRQLREYTGNVFTTYSFRNHDGILRGLSLGGGANYRGEGLVGYDTTRNNAMIYGPAYTPANAMLA